MKSPLLLYKAEENGTYYVKNLINKALISIFDKEKVDLLENKGISILVDDLNNVDFF